MTKGSNPSGKLILPLKNAAYGYYFAYAWDQGAAF
jgi:hypothetical protein